MRVSFTPEQFVFKKEELPFVVPKGKVLVKRYEDGKLVSETLEDVATVWILETGCYGDKMIIGVFSSAEKAMAAHHPIKPETPKYSPRGRRTDTYEWSPDGDGRFTFDADWEDAATVTRMNVDAPDS
jgi:hypothetical protein